MDKLKIIAGTWYTPKKKERMKAAEGMQMTCLQENEEKFCVHMYVYTSSSITNYQ